MMQKTRHVCGHSSKQTEVFDGMEIRNLDLVKISHVPANQLLPRDRPPELFGCMSRMLFVTTTVHDIQYTVPLDTCNVAVSARYMYQDMAYALRLCACLTSERVTIVLRGSFQNTCTLERYEIFENWVAPDVADF